MKKELGELTEALEAKSRSPTFSKYTYADLDMNEIYGEDFYEEQRHLRKW